MFLPLIFSAARRNTKLKPSHSAPHPVIHQPYISTEHAQKIHKTNHPDAYNVSGQRLTQRTSAFHTILLTGLWKIIPLVTEIRSFQDTGGRLDLSLRTFPLLAMDNTGFHTRLVGTLLIRGSVHFKSSPPRTQRALRLRIWEKWSSIRGKEAKCLGRLFDIQLLMVHGMLYVCMLYV